MHAQDIEIDYDPHVAWLTEMAQLDHGIERATDQGVIETLMADCDRLEQFFIGTPAQGMPGVVAKLRFLREERGLSAPIKGAIVDDVIRCLEGGS